jgi:polyhydroxybutyrate depolymerase
VAATFGDSLAARCRLHPAVAVEFFNGTDDPLVPYGGGELSGGRGHALGVEETVGMWAEDEACPATPRETALPDTAHDGTTIVRRSYAPCGGRGAVVAFKVAGGGHTWPGGTQYLPKRFVGIASRNLDASEELWRFFSARRR